MPRSAEPGVSASAGVAVPWSPKNISFSALEQAVRVVLGFAVSTKVARDLGPVEFSDLALGVSLATLFLPVATVGSDAFLLQRLAEGDASDRHWSRPATKARTVGTLVALACAVITAVVVTESGRSATTALLGAALMVTVPIDLAFLRAIARHRLDRVVPWRVAVLVTGAATRLAVLVAGADARGIALVMLCEAVVVSLITRRLSAVPPPMPDGPGAAARAVVTESFPFLVSGLLYAVYLRVDQLLVRVVLGAEEQGVYSVAVRVTELGVLSASIVVPSWAAAVAHGHEVGTDGFHRAYATLFKRCVVSASVVAAATAVAGWLLVEPIFGSQYREARSLIPVLSLATVPMWVLAIRERFIAAVGRGRLQIGPSLMGALVAVGANLVLLPTVGLHGAAWATLVSYSAAAGWTLATRRQRAALAPLRRPSTRTH